MEKGPQRPNIQSPSGYITPEMVYEIAKIKQQDRAMKLIPIRSICHSVIGTARTLGVVLKEADDI